MNIPVVNYKPNTFLDNMIALRLLCLLTTPFNETEAYKAGLINEKGEFIVPKGKRTKEQEKQVNYLIKFVFNVKKLLNKLPGGENKIKNLLAAMWMIKEEIDRPHSQILSESMLEAIAESVDTKKDRWQEMIDLWQNTVQLNESGIRYRSIDCLGNPSSPALYDNSMANPQPNGIGNPLTVEMSLNTPVSNEWMKKKNLRKGENIAMGDPVNIH